MVIKNIILDIISFFRDGHYTIYIYRCITQLKMPQKQPKNYSGEKWNQKKRRRFFDLGRTFISKTIMLTYNVCYNSKTNLEDKRMDGHNMRQIQGLGYENLKIRIKR